MKVLIVHEIDYVHKPFFEFQEFAEGLASKGHDVTVLHVQEFPKGSRKKLPKVQLMQGLEIENARIRLISTRFIVRGVSSRLVAILEHFYLLAEIFRNDRPDVVLSYSVPTSGVSVSLLGKLFGVPVVHRAIDVSHLLRAKYLAPFVRLSELLVFRLSDYISTHNGALQGYIRKTAGRRKRVTIQFPPVYPISKKAKMVFDHGRELRLLFIGSLSHFTDIERVLHSIAELSQARGICLRIVGSGSKERELQRLSNTLGLEKNVEFRGWKHRGELIQELSWADFGIIPFRKNRLTDCALPQKAIEYLSAGINVVSVRLEGAASVLGDYAGVHFVCSSGEIVNECLAISRLQGLPDVDEALVQEMFSREVAFRGIESLLLEAMQGKR